MTEQVNHDNSTEPMTHRRTTHPDINRGDKVQFHKQGNRNVGEVVNIITYDAGRTWIVIDTGTEFKNTRPCFVQVLTHGESQN